MARTLNKVQLIGRLGADPEVKVTPSDLTVATFSLATNRQWTNRDGEMQEETDWHNIVAWDRLAEICGEHLVKGRLVYVEGRLRTRSWEQNGQKQYRTEVVASDMLILDGKGNVADGETEPQARQSNGSVPRKPGRRVPEPVAAGFDDPDELPF
jgi:single-strand DNA-binding protein